MSAYRAEISEVVDISELEKVWLELQQRAECSFFQSWGWIGSWLKHVAGELSPQLLTVYHNELRIGLGIFIPAKIRRHHVINVSAMFLNEAPFAGNNMVIEYNGLLAARGCEPEVYRHAVDGLLQQFPAVDEFHFAAMQSLSEISDSVKNSRETVKYVCRETSVAWSLRLRDSGDSVDDYLQTLGKNRRLQIRRSLRLYQHSGDVHIEQAETLEQALQYFDGLKKLHNRRWLSSGKAGAFANDRWERFHRGLISNCFQRQEIQLLKVSNDEGEIGYLYNFIWRKRVYVLQTGFAMAEDKRLMPGYVTHVMAISHNRTLGMEIYDLMHGDDLYKKLLCNQQQTLYWPVIQRKRWRFVLEDVARALSGKFR